jgi:hypothetical protein
MLESFEASIWPDSNYTAQKLWNSVVPITDEAISHASTIDLKGHNNDPTELIKATQLWQQIVHQLPVTYTGISTIPEFNNQQSYLTQDNTVYCQGPRSYWFLLWYVMNYKSFYRTSPDAVQCQIDYEVNHEQDHALAYKQYGIQGKFCLSFYYDMNDQTERLLAPGFSPNTHSIPISGFVEAALAPSEPSDHDLALVGLTPEIYQQLLADGIDPAMHVLQPWFDAGVLRLSAS